MKSVFGGNVYSSELISGKMGNAMAAFDFLEMFLFFFSCEFAVMPPA
jgi:hypothetical protein